jgi:hypothetical protein
MKAVIRRLCRLEERVAPPEVVEPSWVAVMRERQRRRAEAEGRPYVEPVREPLVVENPNDWAEVMRACRARRAAQSQRAEAEQ